MTLLLVSATAFATLPALLTLWNLTLFRPPPRRFPGGLAVSVVIPARDEAANIGACLDAVIANVGCMVEIVVVDDHSADATPAIVADRAARDGRVRVIVPPPLPAGWAGKPHACWVGAQAATHPVLLFIDADVRLAPDAVARLAGGLCCERLALASGFPRERTGSLGEAMLVPLIHVLLLGYLPFAFMRRSRHPGFGAGCGQMMMAEAAAYRAIGGHGAVRRSWHDGVTLPRAFRARGHMTGLFDATALADCRMYDGWRATWRGFSKNAREGLAKPGALPVWTMLLASGFILAPVLAVISLWPPLLAGVGLLSMSRIAVGVRFRQSFLAVLLTMPAMLLMLALQWRALLRRRAGMPIWRGRIQTT